MPDIERMESHATMPRKGKRQTLMFSATFPDAIQRAASNFLDNYLFLKVGVVGSANSDITQSIFRCHKFEKRDTLLSIFKDLKNIEKTLIFLQQKKMTDFLASYLCQNEVKSTTIHGDRLQEEREEALRQFTRGKMPVLVATDCAARGLDIPDVAHVINYDLPKSMDEYVHRIGRTGRVGNTGRASSFYDPEDDAQMAKNLVKVLVESNQEVPEWLQKESEKQMMSGSYGGFGGYSGKDIRQKNKNDSTLYDDPYDLNRQFATKPSDPLEEDEPWE
jgi:probable ATP-dependent RNA helicase DDX4